MCGTALVYGTSPALCLRACYALCGTALGYGATSVCGTEIAYAAARVLVRALVAQRPPTFAPPKFVPCLEKFVPLSEMIIPRFAYGVCLCVPYGAYGTDNAYGFSLEALFCTVLRRRMVGRLHRFFCTQLAYGISLHTLFCTQLSLHTFVCTELAYPSAVCTGTELAYGATPSQSAPPLRNLPAPPPALPPTSVRPLSPYAPATPSPVLA
eukprot:1765075-Rhodomonas_salina.1